MSPVGTGFDFELINTLLMIGIGARVVTSFAQASFAQEYLMELLLKPSCPGQCYVLPHTRRPGQMWWVHRCQSEG